MTPEPPQSQFLTTQWTRILSSHHTSSDLSGSALTILCETYRAPVYAFILRQKGNPTEADDLTQSFFTFLIEKKGYRQADRQRGKFRTFILASVKNFLRQSYRDEHRQKRGGTSEHIALDQLHDSSDLEEESPPDELFDKSWAISLFDRVWKLLEDEYRQTGQQDRFNALRNTFNLAENTIPYADLAKQLGLTHSGAKSATNRMRSRFRELFRATVAQLIDNPADIDQEIRYLMEVMIKNQQDL